MKKFVRELNKPLLIKVVIFSVVFLHNYIFEVNAATINAASCEQVDVQAAINSVSNGDTVSIPAGNCTWSEGVGIPDDKKITLQGAGRDSTVITRSGTAISMNESGSRVTGIGFIQPESGDQIIHVQGTGWRIDHCKFNNTSGNSAVSIHAHGYNIVTYPTGLIDNNTFLNGRVLVNGLGTFAKMSGIWAGDLLLGTGDAVYVEDNVFIRNDNAMRNAIDSNRGGKYVFRFNSVTNSHLEAHSLQSSNERATRKWEIYCNTHHLESGVSYYYPYRIRGGTGVIFDNTFTGSWYHIGIALDNVRSYRSIGSAGFCDGSSPWDGNENTTGWPCRDQIGRSTDEWLWTTENPYPPQASVPTYLWLNRVGENIFPAVVINNSGDHIKNSRDYYDEAVSFDGSSGTGWGTLANRPTTCTPGVAYWAIDQGDWNQNGDDGVLYKCTSTNTWEVYYIPYTYPHPLITNGTIPEPIINVYPNPCRVFQGENSVTFFGDLSIGDNIKVFDMSGRIVHDSGNLSEATYQWGVGDITSGVYFFVVKSADGQKKTSGKIVIIR